MVYNTFKELCNASAEAVKTKLRSSDVIKGDDVPSNIALIPTGSGGLHLDTTLSLSSDKVKSTGPVTLTAVLQADYDTLDTDLHGYLNNATITLYDDNGSVYRSITNLQGVAVFNVTITENTTFYCSFTGTQDYEPSNSDDVTVEFEELVPSEYQMVEWIRNDGSAWFDTPYTPSNNTRMVVKGIKGTNENAILQLNGNWYSRCEKGFGIIYDSFFFGTNYDVTYDGMGDDLNQLHTWDCSQNGLYCDDELKATLQSQTFTCTKTIAVFLRKEGETYSSTKPFNSTIYWLQFYENNELLYYFIPVYRKSDNVIGMFETVNRVFYTNQGTGTFTKGADI